MLVSCLQLFLALLASNAANVRFRMQLIGIFGDAGHPVRSDWLL